MLPESRLLSGRCPHAEASEAKSTIVRVSPANRPRNCACVSSTAGAQSGRPLAADLVERLERARRAAEAAA